VSAARPWTPIDGGCQCGAVRYRLNAPAKLLSHCHCSMCRKTSGTLFVTGSKVSRTALEILEGEDALTIFESSPEVYRKFCRNCGCPIVMDYLSDLDHVWLFAGTIDGGAHPGHPEDGVIQVFVGSRVPWHAIPEGGRLFEEM
jgi:hypothetical protein